MLDTIVSPQQPHRPVAERREQLIEAAITVLAEHGLDGMTTRRITEEAGLALGAFHYAFESKHALMRAVIERFSDGIDRVLLDSMHAAPIPDDPELLIRRLLDAFWDYVEATPRLMVAQYELTVHALRDPDLRELADLQVERTARAVDRVLTQLPVAREHGQDVCRFIAATMDGLVLHHLVQRDPEAARRRLGLYARMASNLLTD